MTEKIEKTKYYTKDVTISCRARHEVVDALMKAARKNYRSLSAEINARLMQSLKKTRGENGNEQGQHPGDS